MSDQISYSMVLGVASSAPSGLSASGTASIEAYDRISVTVPITTPTTVDIKPADATIAAILIKSSSYDSLTFTVDGGLNPIPLDKPFLLIGAGQIALLGECNEIEFTNGGDAAVVIDILVGRSAIEASQG